MAAIEIGQLPLTTGLVGTTFIPVENANITQKIEAASIRNYVTTLEFLNSTGNVTAANLVTSATVFASTVRLSGQLVSTVATGTAPLSVVSTTQVPNLYASRAAVADTTTNGLTINTSFANVVATDVIISGNNSTITANLKTVNVNTGTFGNTVAVPQLTVDAKGRVLAVSNVAITFPVQTLISNTSEITANTVSGTPGLNLTTTGVTPGTYGGAVNVPQITVDSKGRITNLSSIPVNSTLNTLNIGIPIGTIAIWSGALNTIPDGWQLADGTNGTLDLRDRFVVGAGSLYNPGTTGGSADAVLPSHTHTATSTSTFTGAALGTHSHGVSETPHDHVTHAKGSFGGAYAYLSNNNNGYAQGGGAANFGYSASPDTDIRTSDASTGVSIQAQSAGTPSGTVVTSTTLSTEGVTASNRNLPPYYALYYIQKMTDAVSINNPINYMATIGNIIAGGNLVAASGNASVSTTTGALVVVGGAGVSGNLNVGGTITMPTMPAGTSNTAVATTAFVQVNGTPTGSVMMWPTASPPTGWLLCNGQAVSRATYAALFTIIGTVFGSGDGANTFNVPDYRDRMPVGAGATFSANAAGGSKDAIVVAHTHTGNTTTASLTGTLRNVEEPFGSATGIVSLSDQGQAYYGGTGSTAYRRQANFDASHSHSINISAAGSSGTDANMPPYLGIYFIIKASA